MSESNDLIKRLAEQARLRREEAYRNDPKLEDRDQAELDAEMVRAAQIQTSRKERINQNLKNQRYKG